MEVNMDNENLKIELEKAIKNGMFYDYIASNYYKLGIYALKTILLEVIYAYITNIDKNELIDNLKENL